MAEIYRPKNAEVMSECKDPVLCRLGLQGPAGKGKTHSALTFPYPTVVDYNKGMEGHRHRDDVLRVRFWDDKLIDKLAPRSGVINQANRRDAIINWLMQDGMKHTKDQTIVIDSLTELNNSFHVQYQCEGGAPISTKTGKPDTWDCWGKKKTWYTILMDVIKALPCNCVIIGHELPEREDGEPTGKMKLMIEGGGGDKIVGDATDWFRCHAVAKPIADAAIEPFKLKWGIRSKDEYDYVINSTPKDHMNVYFWQVYPDEKFELKTQTLFGAPKFVVADYKSFLKYRRVAPANVPPVTIAK
jgi:hypothetical protein